MMVRELLLGADILFLGGLRVEYIIKVFKSGPLYCVCTPLLSGGILLQWPGNLHQRTW